MNKDKDIYFSKHALERYKERFGYQDISILCDRFHRSSVIDVQGNIEHRQWGAIIFVSIKDNDGNYNVLTVKKANK